jgi:hypothetical protein
MGTRTIERTRGPDSNDVSVKLKASYRGGLTPDPQHHFPHLDRQIFNGDTSPNVVATMKGFVQNYNEQRLACVHPPANAEGRGGMPGRVTCTRPYLLPNCGGLAC